MAVVTSTILTAAAAAAGIGSTIMQGRAANDASKAQARNLAAEQRNKQLEFTASISREREKSRRALSTIRARLAQTGTDTTAGTPLQILGESAGNLELSFQDAARAQTIQDQSLQSAISTTRYQGKQARRASLISAGGQLLQAAGQMGRAYSGNVAQGLLPDTFQLYKPKPRA